MTSKSLFRTPFKVEGLGPFKVWDLGFRLRVSKLIKPQITHLSGGLLHCVLSMSPLR